MVAGATTLERGEDDRIRSLIERARQRDEAALNELLTAHSQRLLESVRAELGERLRQRLESQDVVQQVYLDALRSIDRFVDQGHDSFFRWLKRIALNRICDADRRAFKTAKRAGEVRGADLADAGARSSADLLAHLPDSLTGPLSVAERADQLRRLDGAFGALSEEQRLVLQLRYAKQFSIEETAAQMDRSETAVRSLCARALIRLRELLEHDR